MRADIDHDTVKRWGDHLLHLEYVLLGNADEATKKAAQDWKNDIKSEIRQHTDLFIEDVKVKAELNDLDLDQEHRLYNSYENLGSALWLLGIGMVEWDTEQMAKHERFIYDFLMGKGGSFKGKTDFRRRIRVAEKQIYTMTYDKIDEAIDRLVKRKLIAISNNNPKVISVIGTW